MARRAATGGGARKQRSRKAAKTVATKHRRKPASVAELRAQMSAASRVLELIGKSPSDLQPVFDAIAESARDLTGATYCSLARLEDGLVKIAANCGWKDDALAAMNRNYPRPVGRDNPLAVAILDGAVQNVADILNSDANYTRGLQAISGYRSMLVVPIMRALSPVGAICIFSRKVGVFQQRHIDLLKTFAAQAVIAIENTRLFNEVQTKTRDLEESLQQQTATADVLKVINRSTFDLQAALTALVEAARELCNAQIGTLFLPQDGVLRLASQRGCPPDLIEYFADNPLALDQNIGAARAFRTGQPVHLPDVLAEPGYSVSAAQRLGGWRSLVAVPLLRGQDAIGVFSLSRTGKPEPFTQRQIDLLNTFADQAVIAIENARLFNETQESLQQQTATAEVLQIISDSPGELQPVFEAVLQKATRISDARFGSLLRFDGNSFYFAADVGTPEALREYMRRPGPFQGLAGGMIDRIHRTRQVQNSADYAAEAAPGLAAKLGGARSTLGVPILREDELVGAIVIYRQEVRPFSEREIELVRSFASQAAIAIENARLFNETKEALERQTATADILKVIASSPDNVQPVFEAIASSARRLIGGFSTAVHLVIDDMVHLAAFTPTTPEADEILIAAHPRHRSEVRAVALVENGEIAQIGDSETADPHTRQLGRARGWRSVTLTPLMNHGSFIGFIASTRREPGVLADSQLELLRTFADQAVIAIENARLFDEVQAKTRDLEESLQQQTATADILRIISRSVAHAAPVFDTILESCERLFKPYDAAVYLVEGDKVKGVARRGPGTGEWGTDSMPLEGSSTGMAIAQRRPVHFPDLADKADLPEDKRARVREAGGMTVLYAPMISHDSGVGSLVVTRRPKKPFTDAEIRLIQTFADQAVIAIENARLFEEVQARTQELSKSLEDLRTAQDRLVQTEKLASLGQLTAGIAHEIKNPLNFVNNFSALSAELIDELDETLAPAPLDRKMRDDVGELTQMLKSNLEKVVQHGKRADSIVKNMLLHSREGSGERRSTSINGLVEESLNLAYHGARAERASFNITLKHDLDPDAGALDLYPQDITRALLNLISNGFYAAISRKAETGDDAFEPVLSAATRGLGGAVEIRIRDNGSGIPPEVREKIFNPFFTTKPTGEGTGLGLSMTHDIVVKQHGGKIDVETKPGEFTEFIITLPRGNGSGHDLTSG